VNITEVCIRKPVLAWMLMTATVVFGVVALSRIGTSQFPDVDFPTINVSVEWEGAAPEVIEQDVVEILEESLTLVEGVRTISSSSRQGSADITIELDLDRNVDLALQDVQSKVSEAQRRLPLDIEAPTIRKNNPEDNPIMWVGLSGAVSPQLISDTARYVVKEKLQTIEGVGEVMMGGFLERNVRIWVDTAKLEGLGVTVTDVIAALQLQHVELPAGRLEAEGREVNVRVLGEALDLATLRRLVVRQTEGAPVRLEDIALIEDGFEDVRRLARINGEPAQGLGIKKQRGSNAVAVGEGVRAAIEDIQKTLPDGMRLAVNFDSTQFIKESVDQIEHELILAVLLTALVCWVFLGSLSSTLNVVLAIPMSLLGTIAIIYFLGYTLNTFTLLALSLSVGIVVDDAIMVLENIYRHIEAGEPPLTAASKGTAEITFAALAATIAVIAIFLPVVFMEGLMGLFFMQFGVTLSIAVALSYLEAITLAPARTSQIVRSSHDHERKGLGKIVDDAFDALARGYARVLALGLKHPIVVLGIAVAVFFGAYKTIGTLPSEFVPSQDQSRLMVRMTGAVGSDLEEMDRLVRRAETFAGSLPEVDRLLGVIGGMGGSGVNGARFFVTLKPPEERDLTQNEVAAVLRKELNSYPGMRAVVQDLSQSGFTAQRGFPIEFSVQGPEWGPLVETSQRMMEELRASGTVVDLDTNYELGMPELRITPDRDRAADLGVPIQEIAGTINALVGGVRVGKYSSGGRRIDVRLKLIKSQRSRPEDLSRLQVRTGTGSLVPLSSLVQNDMQPALQQITRRDRERAINIYANVAEGHAQNEVLALVEKLGKDVPDGYRVMLGGSSSSFRESMDGLIFALILGIIVAYMVLASQFNSLIHPLTVLTILPLSIAGAVFALKIGGQSINIFSMIGILLLMGIVKKNSIILVDYANQVRKSDKLDALGAMLRAGPVRLRPILMTSFATLAAAVPAALALGPGSEVRAPMAFAVIGGLVVSTLLSLLVVPAFYVSADHGLARVRRLFGREKPRPAPHEDAPVAIE
jgi:hydrophobe/amphiphile efflux-1 (HAE1) family protein